MNADSLMCSHSRSGGRWLRFLVAHYLEARYHLDTVVSPESVFSIVPDHHRDSARGYPAFRFGGGTIPLLAVCHQPYTWELHRGYPIIFLARNAYDVVVSAYYHLAQEKGEYAGTMRDFLRQPRGGLPSWIAYMNIWAPKLITHRDVTFVAYGELDSEPELALRRVLTFIDEDPDPFIISAAVAKSQALRDVRKIRTGQEGNFWDHLQPEEIFEVQEMLQTGLTDLSCSLLQSIGVELDPFPRSVS